MAATALLALLAALGAVACRTKQPKPNVILISLDTLRADHLGVYGYQRPTSPFIDRYAAEATLFRNAISPSAWTLPAHTSIMVSQYPQVHGVIDSEKSIPPEAVTLAEILRDDGYATAGFVSAGLLDARYGFARGFYVYQAARPAGAEAVNRAALDWVKKAKEPYFLFLHYYDVHHPYDKIKAGAQSYCGLPRAQGESQYAQLVRQGVGRLLQEAGIDDQGDLFAPPKTDVDAESARRSMANLRAVMARLERDGVDAALKAKLADAVALTGPNVSAPIRECVIGLYDDGIAYLDSQLAELFRQLESTGMRSDDTLVILTSDHGENLYDHHDYRTHSKYVYQSLVHVPLIIKLPGQKMGAEVNDVVSTIDLLPTILARLGISPPELIQGRDLAPLMNGQRTTDPIAAVSASTPQAALESVIMGSWKLIRGPQAAMLFDIRSDPSERNDLGAVHAARVAELQAELHRLTVPLDAGVRPGKVELDAASRERLRALGYDH